METPRLDKLIQHWLELSRYNNKKKAEEYKSCNDDYNHLISVSTNHKLTREREIERKRERESWSAYLKRILSGKFYSLDTFYRLSAFNSSKQDPHLISL